MRPVCEATDALPGAGGQGTQGVPPSGPAGGSVPLRPRVFRNRVYSPPSVDAGIPEYVCAECHRKCCARPLMAMNDLVSSCSASDTFHALLCGQRDANPQHDGATSFRKSRQLWIELGVTCPSGAPPVAADRDL